MNPVPESAVDTRFHPDSRVWIYVAERPLSPEEAGIAIPALEDFARRWTAHNQALKARAELFHQQIIVLMVDETQAGASGCSIDTSVHFLEALGHQLGVDLFDRMTFGYADGAEIRFVPRPVFKQKIAEGEITETTLVANTLAKSRRELETAWLMPFAESWLKRVV